MPGEGIAGKLLGEILHHVVALELAMNQHVEADIFLPAHGARGLVLQEHLVGGIAERALRMRGAGVPDVGGLRERADGRGRKRRQLPFRLLFSDSRVEVRPALRIGGNHVCHPLLHQSIVDARRIFPRMERGARRCQLSLGRLGIAIQYTF